MLGDIDPLAPGRGVAQSGGVRAKWLIGLMGAGTLAPWNAWLLAYGYFDTVFGEHYNIAYVFTVCYFAPTALTILLMLRRTPLSRISVRARIVFAYITNTLLLLVPVVLVLLGTFDPEPRGGTPPDAFPWMVVVIVLSGMTTGILYGSLFSYITILPPSYTQVIRLIGAEGPDRRPPVGACRLFLGPGFRLGPRWNRLVKTVKTRKKREKTGKKWARYGLKGVKDGS